MTDITAGLEYLSLDRVLSRGTGTVIEKRDDALLVFDSVSEAYLLACDGPASGIPVLDRHIGPDTGLLMISDPETGRMAFERFGFTGKLECRQTAWLGGPPAEDPRISVRTADRDDLPLLVKTYDLISPEEMEQVVERGSMLFGYKGDLQVGFIGEHLEGSMGLLYVFPEFRRQGYGAALEKAFIKKTLEKGLVPFGQVEKDNRASLELQTKIGMTVSGRIMWWMWK